MEVQRRPDPSYRSNGYGRIEAVMAPPIHEGIGNALKRVYVPRDAEVPVDFYGLLDKLH